MPKQKAIYLSKYADKIIATLPNKELLSTATVADRLSLSRSSVNRLLTEQGRPGTKTLKGVKVGYAWRVYRESVLELLAEGD